MPLNTKLIEIHGPFFVNQDIFSLLKNEYSDINFDYIQRIGIFSKTGHVVRLNNKDFELGKTGILEFNDVQISSISFLQNEDAFTTVDCIVV